MRLITYFSVLYVLMGMLISLLTWYTLTQYDAEEWKHRRPVTWEELFITIFIWPMFLMTAFGMLSEFIPFYRKHTKLLFSIAAIVTSIDVIVWSFLNAVG